MGLWVVRPARSKRANRHWSPNGFTAKDEKWPSRLAKTKCGESGFFKGAHGNEPICKRCAPRCPDCTREEPHIHCPECGDITHTASECDMND